jgi:SNF2 family DNA or RNA helicase
MLNLTEPDRNWQLRPWMEIHRTDASSYDTAASFGGGWKDVDVPVLVQLVRAFRNGGQPQIGSVLESRGALVKNQKTANWHHQDGHLRKCLKLSLTPEVKLPAGAALAPEHLVAFWCDSQTALCFSPESDFAIYGTGYACFYMPQQLADELGVIEGETGLFKLHKDVTMVPTLQHIYRTVGHVHYATIKSFPVGMYRARMLTEVTATTIRFRFATDLNVPQLRNWLEKGREIPDRLILRVHLHSKVLEAINAQTYTAPETVALFRAHVNHPAPCPDRIQQAISAMLPAGSVTPYPYQLANVNAMCNMEAAIDAGTWCIRGQLANSPQETVRFAGDLGFDMVRRTFRPVPASDPSESGSEATNTIPLRGGALFDDTGLGKSLSIALVACLRGPRTKPTADADGLFSTYGGTLIVCPSQVVSQFSQEIRRVKGDAKIVQLLAKRHHDRVTYRELVEADFVLVSDSFITNAACRRPTSEYSADRSDAIDCFRTELAFRMDRHALKPENPLDFDIMKEVGPSLHAIRWSRIVLDEIHFHLANRERFAFLEKLEGKYVHLLTGTPAAGTANGTMDDVFKYFQLLHSDNLARTAYPLPDATSPPLPAVTEQDRKRAIPQAHLFEKVTFDEFLSKAVIRHTKASVAAEIALPGVVEEVVWVDFSFTERALYEHLAANYPGQLSVLSEACCHPHIATGTGGLNLKICSDLNDVREKMTVSIRRDLDNYVPHEASQRSTVAHFRQQLVAGGEETFVLEHEARIEQGAGAPQRRDELPLLEDEIEDGEVDNDEDAMLIDEDGGGIVRQAARVTLTRTQRRFIEEKSILVHLDARIQALRRTLAFFDNAVHLQPGEKCTVCLDELVADSRIAFLQCGHHFCHACTLAWTRQHRNCPMCRASVSEREILTVAGADAKAGNTSSAVLTPEDRDYEAARQVHGSKMAAMLKLIKELQGEKVVVFSRFDQWVAGPLMYVPPGIPR